MCAKKVSNDLISYPVVFSYRNEFAIGDAIMPTTIKDEIARVLFQPKNASKAKAISAEDRNRATTIGLFTTSAKTSSTRKASNQGHFFSARAPSTPSTAPMNTNGLR